MGRQLKIFIFSGATGILMYQNTLHMGGLSFYHYKLRCEVTTIDDDDSNNLSEENNPVEDEDD